MNTVPRPSAKAYESLRTRAERAEAQVAALRDLAEAIRAAAVAPMSARNEHDRAWHDLQRDRAIQIESAARWALGNPDHVAIAARSLRDGTKPPAYEIYQAEHDELEGGQ